MNIIALSLFSINCLAKYCKEKHGVCKEQCVYNPHCINIDYEGMCCTCN